MKTIATVMIFVLAAGCDVAPDRVNEAEEAEWRGLMYTRAPHCDICYKMVTIKGHDYLTTFRNGPYSYNASTIHAASCQCMKGGQNVERERERVDLYRKEKGEVL